MFAQASTRRVEVEEKRVDEPDEVLILLDLSLIQVVLVVVEYLGLVCEGRTGISKERRRDGLNLPSHELTVMTAGERRESARIRGRSTQRR